MDGETRELRRLLGLAVVVITLGGMVNLFLDRPADWLSAHVLIEILTTTAALVIAIALWLGWWRSVRSIDALRIRLDERKAERDAWRRSSNLALTGLASAIDQQFEQWALTPSEREVALLLLKGYSHKHVAEATGRSERTARQHAAAVYQKAGLEGRAELAAFFLEDLMLPGGQPIVSVSVETS